jgi:GT2 family glycosyltransferase
MTNDHDLTVSCVLYKTDADEVRKIIAQVKATPLRTHLYLIDNSPGLREGEYVGDGVTTIVTGRNLGYGAAHNIAIKRSRSAVHLIANTDVVFDPHVIPGLLRRLEQSVDVGLIAPRVRYADGSLQHLCRLLPGPADLIARRFFKWTKWGRCRDDRYELRAWSYDHEADIPFISGCFMLARTSILHLVNGFDERFFLYFEDTDLSRRIGEVARTLFFPDVEITHGYRSKTSPNKMLLLYLAVSGARYFRKWGWFFDKDRDGINQSTLGALIPNSKRV